MKRFISLLVLTVSHGLLLHGATPATRPNFVFILGEGHGWSSTSVRMDDTIPESKSAFVRTPNLEKLAQTGMRLANFYAPAPVCTPSRATYLTGKSPSQLHITFPSGGKRDSKSSGNTPMLPPPRPTDLSPSETTIAALLKCEGYATAHFGKWHVGRIDPKEYGFDASDGPTENGGPDNVDNPHPKQLFGMTERGIEFMTRQVHDGKPFYLQMSHYVSSRVRDARPESIAAVKGWGLNESEAGTAAAALDLDVALGMVLKTLDELGIANNTYVIFTTDHGSEKNPPFTGGKGTVSEGALRVPFIIRGPGIKHGACSHVRTIGADLFPTVAELVHVSGPLPNGVEGGSLVSVLTNAGNGTVRRPREEFVVTAGNRTVKQPSGEFATIGPASAILLGDFKLIHAYETGALELFNIAKDPGEHRDLAQQMPNKVNELDQRLADYLTAMNVQMPTKNPNYNLNKPTLEPNPDYDPSAAKKRGGQKGKKGGKDKK